MRSDGHVLPDPAEAAVLHELGLVRTNELPDLAARWLATDLADSEAVRLLAGHDAHDPWTLERLLADVIAETATVVPTRIDEHRRIAVEWVTMQWRESRDTPWAITTLARLGEADPDFDLGLFVSFDDERSGGWGRLEPDLMADAARELGRLLHGDGGPA